MLWLWPFLLNTNLKHSKTLIFEKLSKSVNLYKKLSSSSISLFILISFLTEHSHLTECLFQSYLEYI